MENAKYTERFDPNLPINMHKNRKANVDILKITHIWRIRQLAETKVNFKINSKIYDDLLHESCSRNAKMSCI